jgi:DNA repair exonuclease SbcCD ATPase subunit
VSDEASEACCACMTVRYKPEEIQPSRFKERWTCQDCGTDFVRRFWLDRLTAELEAARESLETARRESLKLCVEVKRLKSLIGDALTAESQAMGLYEDRVKCDACGGLTPDAWIVHEEGDRTECLRCWHKENERELRAELERATAQKKQLGADLREALNWKNEVQRDHEITKQANREAAAALLAMQADLESSRARVKELEGTLRHYANEDNWRWCKEHFYPGDGPDIARTALRAAEEEKS